MCAYSGLPIPTGPLWKALIKWLLSLIAVGLYPSVYGDILVSEWEDFFAPPPVSRSFGLWTIVSLHICSTQWKLFIYFRPTVICLSHICAFCEITQQRFVWLNSVWAHNLNIFFNMWIKKALNEASSIAQSQLFLA